MNLTVLCVFVTGHVPFTGEYVTRLRDMARRRLPAHRFVCLTDRVSELPVDIEVIPVTPKFGIFAWWTKVQLFNPALPVSGRLLYFDLDVLLVDDCTEIAEYNAPFALVPDGAPNFKPHNGLKVVKKFNSSVMAWNHCEQSRLFNEWTPQVAKVLWGDQDWIGQVCPNADVMPAAWFPRLSQVNGPPWSMDTKVILCKKPKNREAVRLLPWFKEAWQ